MKSSAQFISYAQHGEDVVLWRALGDRPAGRYVDVGAFDPSYDSVTRAFYERGWRGINIEPQPDQLGAFERERPEDTNLSMAIGDHDGTATLTFPHVPGWATTLDPVEAGFDAEIDGALEVPIRRIDTLLAELGVEHVDILTIDVEGTEPAVVRGFVGSKYRPVVCVIAGVAPGVGRAAGDEAVALLVGAGYVHCLFDGLNHYLTIDPTLKPALSVPANPIDGYVSAALVKLEEERRALHESIATLVAENLGLRAVPTPADSGYRDLTPAPNAADQGSPGPVVEIEAAPVEVADLPLPASVDEDADVDVEIAPSAPVPVRTPSAPVPVRERQSRVLEPAERSARRRATFVRLLSAVPASRPPDSASDVLLDRHGVITVTDLSPAAAISAVYQAVLGRPVDSQGLAVWTAHLNHGKSLLDIARALERSDEGLRRPSEHRARIESELRSWESLVAATELGAAAWHVPRTYGSGTAAHEIFVGALFEVALQRRPSVGEAQLEVAKLVGGVGREWLLRAYAVRPEARLRFLGQPAPGLRARLRRFRDGRRLLETFRALVTAAESRQIAQILANVALPGSSLPDLVRVPTITSEEH